ncbi:hypothetical protein LCGC14_1240250 [marine sediment metagenome]|uniref:Uncharacterized protein n=2 Tax=marine sediment metagenome TaxID=412755 RepID=A0A0F9NN87_9ZZZZ
MTYTSTYVTCRLCSGRLTEKRETACEPAHYECKTCGAIFDMSGKPFDAATKLRLPDPARTT